MPIGDYGYDPSKYTKDFSWVGQVGNTIAQAAQTFPELIELNKSIHENKFHNNQAYQATNQWIDAMAEKEPDMLKQIAKTMNFKVDPNTPEDQLVPQLSQQLKAKIPKPQEYKDTTTNQEYTMTLANEFYTPFLNAAQSGANGKKYTYEIGRAHV